MGEPVIRVLLASTLYPTPERPRHGLFVARRFAELRRGGKVDGTVLAPRPLPIEASFRRGIDRSPAPLPATADRPRLLRPTFTVIKGLGGLVHPLTLARSMCRAAGRLDERFDLVDGHYLFPDGIAAVRLANRLRLPVVLTARGSDVNHHAFQTSSGRWVRWALRRANQVICVSEALAERVRSLGAVEGERLHVLRNGVDLAAFAPRDGQALRAQLLHDPRRKLLLMVGNLTAVKGQDLALAALAELADCELALVGTGPDENELRKLAARLGVDDRVHFLGGKDAAALPEIYSAADALWMASRREGMPNVVLESQACGLPVCGLAVGGVPEVVDVPGSGRLASADSGSAGLVSSARELLSTPPSREAVRRHAERFSWDATTRGQLELFRKAIAEGPRTRR